MKISLKNFFLCAVAAVGLTAAGSASAASIVSFAGLAQLDPNADPNSIADATSIIQFRSIFNQADKLNIGSNSGIFAPLDFGDTFDTDTSPAFVFAGAGSWASPIFSLGDYSFTLNSLTNVEQDAAVLEILGLGTITGPLGFDPVGAQFTLTTQGPTVDGFVTISGSLVIPDSVPEGGSAVLFLGLGMIGVETLRRRMVKASA